jgi:hypothetical protein
MPQVSKDAEGRTMLAGHAAHYDALGIMLFSVTEPTSERGGTHATMGTERRTRRISRGVMTSDVT